MRAEIGGRSTAAVAFLTVFNFLLGAVCIYAGVLLMGSFTSEVRNVLANVTNLPVNSMMIDNGLTPLVIVSPQAIILPSIIGIVAVCSRKRCGYVAYLIFAILSSLWIPIQTAAALLFACCYAIAYAARSPSVDASGVSTDLLKMFFCLIGLFAASLVSWVLTIVGSIISCCNTCCYEHVRPRHEEEVPLIMSLDSGGILRAGVPLDAPGRSIVEAQFLPYAASGPFREGQGYTMLMTAASPPAAWQLERETHSSSAAPPPSARATAAAASAELQSRAAAPPPAQPRPPPPPAQDLAATGDYERQLQLDTTPSLSAARYGPASAGAAGEPHQPLLARATHNSSSNISLMKFDD